MRCCCPVMECGIDQFRQCYFIHSTRRFSQTCNLRPELLRLQSFKFLPLPRMIHKPASDSQKSLVFSHSAYQNCGNRIKSLAFYSNSELCSHWMSRGQLTSVKGKSTLYCTVRGQSRVSLQLPSLFSLGKMGEAACQLGINFLPLSEKVSANF